LGRFETVWNRNWSGLVWPVTGKTGPVPVGIFNPAHGPSTASRVRSAVPRNCICLGIFHERVFCPFVVDSRHVVFGLEKNLWDLIISAKFLNFLGWNFESWDILPVLSTPDILLGLHVLTGAEEVKCNCPGTRSSFSSNLSTLLAARCHWVISVYHTHMFSQ
jgi:hypothetical protein